MALIHYYIHGRGRGHATRSHAVITDLVGAGHAVRAFAGRDGRALIGGLVSTESVESLWPQGGRRNLSVLRRRVWSARRRLRHDAAAAVISDGDLPSLLAARSLGIPSIAVGHGLVFSHCRRPAGQPLLPWLRQAALARLSSLGANHQVAVNFVPVVPYRASTIVAAPELDGGLGGHVDREGAVLCYFRDHNGDEVLTALVERGAEIWHFSDRPTAVAGIQSRPLDRLAFVDALNRCRAVVCSAGSQLISECSALGLPVFAMYRHRDDEQRLNVSMLAAAGLGQGCSFQAFLPEMLDDFLPESVLETRGPVPPTVGLPVGRAVVELVAEFCQAGV